MLFKRGIQLLLLLTCIQPLHAQDISFKYHIDQMAIFHGDSQVCNYQFTELCDFSEGLAWAAKGELYGYIDSFGNEKIPFIYHDVRSFRNNVAFVSSDSGFHFGLIDKGGTALCNEDFTQTLEIRDNLVAVRGEQHWGVLNIHGALVLDTIYKHPPIVVSNSFIIVFSNSRVGIMNAKKNILHPFKYDFITANGEAYIGKKKYWLNLR
jgi:hypothetical protein